MVPSNNQLPKSTAQLVDEVPLAIVVNGISFAVMLTSPFDIEDFVIGFLHSESVIRFNHDIHDIEIVAEGDAQIANVTLANRCFEQLNQKKRELKGVSGCGLCGTKALDMAFPTLEPIYNATPMSLDKVSTLKAHLREWQRHGYKSGALHAAFWIDKTGKILHCREDIGRHNALDKIIGLLIQNQTVTSAGAVLVTSRCSVELVQKTILAGVENLISLASPSTLAVKMAKAHGLVLIHIPKHDHPYYLTGAATDER